MENFHYLHLSNRTERLYQQLKECLFANSHPLTRRVIIVPSAAMKSWLTLQLAQDPMLGISAGIEIGYVEPSINNLCQILSDQNSLSLDVYEPTELELGLALEDSIIKAILRYYSSAIPTSYEWLPLFEYLGVSHSQEKKLSKRMLNRIRALALVLAKLFRDYGIYGAEIIASWKLESSGWQSLLWEQMEIIFASWNYPAKKLASFQIDKLINSKDVQVHLFGLSFLAPLHHRFLQKIAAHLPVYYYLLSPCQKFWGDTLSDKESMRLKDYWDKQEVNQSSREALEEFLRDKNPLLANFGRLGREMTCLTEAMDSFSSETYALPESILDYSCYHELEADDILMEETSSPLTMLQAVQADIALLRSPEKGNKIQFKNYDESIQMHAVPKKMREVQVIYDALMSIIDKHSQDASPILPSDVFVMSPNISEYAPFIRSVFESPESQLDIQLTDLQIPSQHVFVQGFLHLLSLSQGRWEASALLQLFEYAAFRARHRLTKEDLATLQKWVKKSGIYWGKDLYHRKQVFKREYDNDEVEEKLGGGTWEQGLGRVLEGLVMLADDQFFDEKTAYNPLEHVDSSHGDLLGNVIQLLRSLQSDLKPLIDGTELSLKDWSAYLTCLCDAYFLCEREEGDIEGRTILMKHIESFAKASKKLGDAKYFFESIRRYLDQQLKEETAIYRESNLHAVRFSSLLPMRAVPAKVIVLMGMGDGQFPRMDQTNTLNLLLNDCKADYFPASVDFDRYIFLESLLSARQYFIISYISQEAGDTKCQAPSLVAKELLGYLDHTYSIYHNKAWEKPSNLCIYQHPLNSFHHSYFSKENKFKSYSYSSYLAALAHYYVEKRPKQDFITDFLPLPMEPKLYTQELKISLKELLAFSKNPLRVYLNQVLGIYLDQSQDRIIKDEEDLFLSDLNASLVTKQGLFGSKARALIQAEMSGKLPQNAFKVVGAEKVGREIDQCTENLKRLGIDSKSIFSIEFTEKYTEAKFDENGWKIPAIMIEVFGIAKVKIIGHLEQVCEQGLIQVSQDETKKVMELWPSYLILRWIIEKYQLSISPQIIFVKGKKTKIRKFNKDPMLTTPECSLKNYLEYYLKTKSHPSAFVPAWVSSFFTDSSKVQKNVFKDDVNETYQPKFDQYMCWLERNSPNTGLESAIDDWQSTAQNLFVNLFSEGKAKKSVGLVEEYDNV